jgi:hypothetical protein
MGSVSSVRKISIRVSTMILENANYIAFHNWFVNSGNCGNKKKKMMKKHRKRITIPT